MYFSLPTVSVPGATFQVARVRQVDSVGDAARE